MIWLKWIALGLLALLVLAVIVLKLLGLREGSNRLATSLEIARPPADVFRWISEPSRIKQWLSWTTEIRIVEETPNKVGSKEIVVMADPNSRDPVEMQVTTLVYDQDQRVKVQMDPVKGGFSGTADYKLTATPSGTRLDYDSTFDIQHWAFKLFVPIVMPQARKKLDGDLATLKRLAEAEPKPAAP